jgi:uncharacterized protein
MFAAVKRGLQILAGALAAALLGLLALPWIAPLFLFRPEPLAAPEPDSIGFAARDGSRLAGRWIPPPDPTAPVVLLVHGSSGNLGTRRNIVRRLADDGFGVLIFDYRGYGASQGSPSERGVGEDSLSAYDWLRGRGVAAERIVVIGQSMGNSPAALLASKRSIAGLVLVSPFTSLPEAAGDRFAPLGWMPWPVNRFEVAAPLARTRAPALLVVARDDRLVPASNARRLAGRGAWIELDGGHDGLLARALAQQRLQPFVRAAGGLRAGSAGVARSPAPPARPQ